MRNLILTFIMSFLGQSAFGVAKSITELRSGDEKEGWTPAEENIILERLIENAENLTRMNQLREEEPGWNIPLDPSNLCFSTHHYIGWVRVHKFNSGEYKDFHGRGVYNDTSGNIYDGDWVKGQKCGEGVMEYANGDIYEGTWKDDVRNGKGIMIYKNLDRYYGDWVEGQRDGEGVMMDDGNTYDGGWVEGLKFGEGVMIYANGDRYNGMWKDDVRNGKGIMIYKNLDRYDGDWVEGQRDGEGVMKYASGDKYKGLWGKGKWLGKGKLTCADYSEYIGDWTFNEATKQSDLLRGKVIYANGRTYEGELDDLTEHGSGVMTYENGYYDGQWCNGKKHGPGTFTLKNKSTIKGNWEKDEIRVVVYQGRIIHDGKWLRGQKIKACLSEKTLSSPRGTSPRTIWEANLEVSTNPTWARAAQNNPQIRRTPTYWDGDKIFDKKGESEDVSSHLIGPPKKFISSVKMMQSVSVPRVAKISDRDKDTRD
jgi:hypothetical protein